MAVYADMRAFHRILNVEEIASRADCLYKVKWATLLDTTPYPDTENLKGVLFAMHVGILQTSHACRVCGHDYHTTYRRDRDTWEWSRQGGGRRACQRSRKSLTAGTVLEKVKAKNWLNFFDAYCMWTFDYPRRLLEQETGVRHKQWLQWEKVWHAAVEMDLEHRLNTYALAATPPKSANRMRAIKKPAAASKKRPAASGKVMKHVLKRPSASSGILKRPAKFSPKKQRATPNAVNFYKKYKYVLGVDESHLNKSKPGVGLGRHYPEDARPLLFPCP